MRTLKKTLCLVLVLAMMVGLLAVGASAVTINDYKDKDEIKHPEAVAVLTAIGVLQGDDKGTFRPAEPLTRAESAAFFARLCATNGAGTSTFTDMGAYAWAQPYVAYCQAAGIIAGNGDGTFNPGGNTSYIAWAKMCLCALGYDPAREGLVGDQWEINTIKLVNTINLAQDVLDFDWNAPITRDDAAQFAFNTLNADMRDYSGFVNVTTGDGTKVEVGGGSTYAKNDSYDYEKETADGHMQFVENYFPTLKLSGVTADGFGAPSATWFKGDDRTDNTWTPTKTVATVPCGTIIKTYAEGLARVSYGTIASDAGFIIPTTVTIYKNGVKDTLRTTISPADNDITKGDYLSKYAGGEATLIKYRNNFTLVIKYPYLAQVTGVTSAAETTSKSREVTLKVFKETNALNVTYKTDLFAKKDYVLIYLKGDIDANKALDGAAINNDPFAIKSVTAVDSVTGNLTNRGYGSSGLNSLTIDGVAYGLSGNCFNKVPSGDPEINSPITAYVSNGYTMGYLGGDLTASNYVFVLGSASKSTALGGAGVIEVGYMKQDGTTEVVDSTLATEITNPSKLNIWYAMGKKGAKYTFTEATGAIKNVPGNLSTTDGVALTATRPTIADGITTNDSTVFLIKHKSGTDTAISTYTGIRNVPTFKGTGTYAVKALVFDATNVTAAVYIDLSAVAPSGASSKPIFIVNANKTSETVNADGEILRGYSYINTETGKLDTVTAIGDAVAPTVGLNTPVYDKNGYMADRTVSTATDGVVIKEATQTADSMTFGGGVLTAKISGNSTSFAVASDAVVYIFKGPATVIVGEPDDLVGRAGDLYAVQASSTDSHLKTIYFVEATT